MCYSTTDMFAAGFQDHSIGKILGVAANTGAGGANVWSHELLVDSFPGPSSPFQPVPGGASFRVAVRRSTRVGEHSGVMLEDLGVLPDKIHNMTKNDVLNANVDLINEAASLLVGMKAFDLSASISNAAGIPTSVTARTMNIDRLDVFVDGRPKLTVDVVNGNNTIALPPITGRAQLELRGYNGEHLAASTRLSI
jgi:hypothetical protein